MIHETSDRSFGPDFVLDLDDPAFVKNPYPTYRWLRESAPAYAWAPRQAVVFTRYKDVKAVLADRRFSNDYRQWEHFQGDAAWPPEHEAYKQILDNGLFGLDEADHARVRKLVSAAFTPRSAERMRGEIQRTVDALLDEKITDGRLNVRDFSEQLPITIIADMLKIPGDLRAEFRAFAVTAIRTTMMNHDPVGFFTAIVPMPRWLKMLCGVIEERRKSPLDNDLLSTLIAARDESGKLSEIELVSLIQALIIAGSDTTVHATNFAIHALLRHPEALAEIRADRSLLRNAIEESLRYDLFGKGGLSRFPREELELGGVRLRKGQMILPFIAAALHDPEIFPEPERFDIRRDLSQTIAFGAGQHFCLGASLARLELEIAVGTLLDRYPTMRLVSGPEFEPNPIMRSIARLDVAVH
jgi:cytochrome P450